MGTGCASAVGMILKPCPPEDVGGVPGYAEFLEARADPKHEAHAEMMDLHTGKFNLDDAGTDRILDCFERLVKKRAPRPRKPKVTSRPL